MEPDCMVALAFVDTACPVGIVMLPPLKIKFPIWNVNMAISGCCGGWITSGVAKLMVRSTLHCRVYGAGKGREECLATTPDGTARSAVPSYVRR